MGADNVQSFLRNKIGTKDSCGLFDLNLCKVGLFQGSIKVRKAENYEKSPCTSFE